MGDLLKVILLGIVEGITEFLPISSTGHLIVAASLLNFQAAGTTFEIFIQLGAVIAVMAYYSQDLIRQVRTVRTDGGTQRLWMAIIIAFVPAGIVGFLFKDVIDAVLFNPRVVAISLIIGGIVFLIVERRGVGQSPSATALTEISPRQALLVGVAQTLALIPGVSRSGASIVGGMLAGLDRQVATQFSFYLAIPTLGIATVYSLAKSFSGLSSHDLVLLTLGTVVSGIIAWMSIAWLLRYVAHNTFVAFGYYRILAGIVILLLSLFLSLSA
ncbi:MAG: undecaprenyl-diphosphate phosphatase [Anaerolineae bacterium]